MRALTVVEAILAARDGAEVFAAIEGRFDFGLGCERLTPWPGGEPRGEASIGLRRHWATRWNDHVLAAYHGRRVIAAGRLRIDGSGAYLLPAMIQPWRPWLSSSVGEASEIAGLSL